MGVAHVGPTRSGGCGGAVGHGAWPGCTWQPAVPPKIFFARAAARANINPPWGPTSAPSQGSGGTSPKCHPPIKTLCVPLEHRWPTMAPRGWACLAGLPAQPLLLLRRRRRANVVEMVKLAGLRGHDVRRLSELLMLSSGRNAAGPCHSPCRHGPKPIPHLIRGMSHPLLLDTQVVPRRSVHFALSTSTLLRNLPPPLPQELRP